MGQESFFMTLPFIGMVSFVAFIAIGVAALTDGHKQVSKVEVLKRLYIYLGAFVTLLLISASFVSLIDLGLRTGVFTKAKPVWGYYVSMPPALTLSIQKSKMAPEEGPTSTVLTCESECTLSEQDKSDIEYWKEMYQNWITQQDLSSLRIQAIITPLSFLIIAGIVFIVHALFIRRDQKRVEDSVNFTRRTYFMALSFVFLIASVVSAGFLLNTFLKAVIPGAEQEPTVWIEAMHADRDGVKSIITCGEKCGLSKETIVTAREWQTDYEEWRTEQGKDAIVRDRHDALSIELAFLLIALPLLLYHVRVAWSDKKKMTPVPSSE